MRYRSMLSLVAAGVLWGIISIFVRNLSAAGLDPLQICLIRMTVAALSYVAMLLVVDRKKFRIDGKDLWMFAGTGIVSVVFFNCCYFYTVIHSDVSVAGVLLYTSPVFVLVFTAILDREKIGPLKAFAAFLTVAGCAFVSDLFGRGWKCVSGLTLATGVASGLFYALYTVFARVALKKYDSLTVTTYTFLMGFLGMLFAGRPAETAAILAAQPKLLLSGAAIGLVCTTLPFLLYTVGLKKIEAGTAAVVVAIEPVVGMLVGCTVFGEDCTLGRIVGMAMILISIALMNRRSPETEAKG